MQKSVMQYLLATFFICVSVLSNAQKGFLKGFIINNAGDTIEGLIEPWRGDLNPASFKFKTTAESEVKTYDTTDVNYFSIGGQDYQRFRLPITMDSQDPKKAASTSDVIEPVTSAVFLEVIKTGKKITLFSYTDEVKTRFYMTNQKNNSPIELIYRVRRIDTQSSSPNSNTYAANSGYAKGNPNYNYNFAYRGMLANVADEAGAMTDKLKFKIKKCGYNSASIREIVDDINFDANRNSTK
jgi:hypothetical protein